jgi:membrane-associated protease RseP (regulator of RpoE activity)
MILLAAVLALSVPALVELPRRPTDGTTPTCPDESTWNALVAHLSGPGCRIVPAFRRGRFVGLRLFGLRPGSPLVSAGFEKGDLLVAADGIDFTTPATLAAVLSSSGPATVTVERRGVRHELQPGCVARVTVPAQQR